jgi:tetratricopeptide (TPR) repeat protein
MSEPPAKPPALSSFERMLEGGKESALLRYSLGNEYLKLGDAEAAAGHFARALELDPKHTASWKLYGKALALAGRSGEALDAYRRGIEVAREKGDRQAEKEMTVFARRLEREQGG